MMETLCSSETSVLTTVTMCNIPEAGTLHSHRHENLKSYIRNDFKWGELVRALQFYVYVI
jgi:hypothetical protein